MKLPKQSDFKPEYMAETVREDLVDQRFFVLDDASWKKFQKILSRPAKIKPGLKRLLEEKAPWE